MVFACVTFLSPAKSEDRKSGEGKTDTNLTNFLSTDAAPGTPTRRHALGRLPTPPPLPENLLLRLHKKLPSAPCEHNLQAPLFSGSWSARTRPEPTQGSWSIRPKGRRRKSRRQSHNFFSTYPAG